LSSSLVLLPSFAYADQQVRAAWYGNELRGHRAASAEMFNPNGLIAAHKSLPFGTCLVVGNPKTGKTIAVRVKDRGPLSQVLPWTCPQELRAPSACGRPKA
jgi:peptidoglycan lytic transglycosylase